MTHPLRGKLSIDVDDQIGVGNIGGIRVDGRKIDVAFFDPRESNAKTKIDTWRGFAGKLSGIRYVPEGWDPGLAPELAAKKGSDYITKLEANSDGTTTRRVDVVEWDVENHSVPWQQVFLFGGVTANGIVTKGIRGAGGQLPNPSNPATLGYRWGRPGVWTMEGRQDPSTSLAHLAAETGLLVGPQLYNGGMTEQWDLWDEIQTWCLGARVPVDKMIPYYDLRKNLRPTAVSEAILFATSRVL